MSKQTDSNQKLTRYLAPKQAAEEIGISPRVLGRWRKKEDGPPWIKLGGRIFYLSDKLSEWFNASIKGWKE
ncbi:MAG: DNA-binding protein [Patescibacteria group bacterium]|nr:DNA-binding protein [Patescibacteria group bacterium]